VKIIQKYVLREHAGPLVFALSALTSIMLLNYVAKRLGDLVGKGLPWTVILEFFLLSLPFTIAMTLPMAVLVAVLYAFSRLAAENEITALKANGVSMTRLLFPVLVGGAVLAVVMISFNDQVLPRTNHRLRTLQGDIARKKPSFALREQIINEVAPGKLFLRTNRLDQATNRMQEVTIYDLSDAMRRRTIYADSGEMAFASNGADLQLTLFDGFMQEVPKDTPTQLQRLYYRVDYVKVGGVANSFVHDSSDTFKSDREMSVCELQNEVARHEREFLRAQEDYRQARDATTTGPAALVALRDRPSTMPGTPVPRARSASLGRTYCDALDWVVRQGHAIASGAGHLAAESFVPRSAWAQQGRDTVRQRPDTVRSRPDSLPSSADTGAGARATVVDSAHRPVLHMKAVDTAGRMVPPPPPPPDSARRVLDSLAAVHPADSVMVPNAAAAGAPPSAGVPPTIPASVAAETAKNAMAAERNQMNQFAVEIHKKFAISLACIVFVLLGAPIALRFPRGGVGVVIGVSLGVFGLYYVGLIAGEALGDRGILPPPVAMQAANIILTAVGLFLLARMGREGATSRGGDLHEVLDALRAWGRALVGRRREPAR
jgi:lipopolysaccharide export system permease protein